MMLRWKIYYAGGATFSDADGGPEDAPADGVLSILQRNDCSHHPTTWLKQERMAWHDSSVSLPLLEGADWYYWRPDVQRWFRSDLMGFIDQAKRRGACYLKQGEYVTHEEWERTLACIQEDTDFPL